MTAPLSLDETFTPAEELLRAWLLPIVTTSPAGRGVGSALWNPSAQVPMPLPYRAVRRISGPRTVYSDEPLMRVHTFGATYPLAAAAAEATDDRLLVLVDYPGYGITLPDGGVVHCDWAEITEAARHEPYGADTVVERFITEVRLGLSLVRAQ
ncbi:uncharacterized protein RMCC_2429 [Mycolicibacterium canariasense]|uniref:Uncharacterized protein n=1 Tax=Mycolicibacterium canariasense TaxID=228230 RepID=A0A117I9X2_MYCCR|nr:hypothetical protein [Mycolicibacterium canariasense]MCV7212664.1 hypothetical protein [Mycolicibacterium canariasense]ORV02501.1 hypothetical protein AWB94_00750 [Mycolicibacterium canariasense]GAS95463.1 uncharacterized protein RMCC_2429 [Mycolicibacterium canariasense]